MAIENEMQPRVDSSERSCLFGDTKGIHKSQREDVECLCSLYLFRQVDGERCFPKTLRAKSCHIVERKLLSVLWVGLVTYLSDCPSDASSIKSSHIPGYSGELVLCCTPPPVPLISGHLSSLLLECHTLSIGDIWWEWGTHLSPILPFPE